MTKQSDFQSALDQLNEAVSGGRIDTDEIDRLLKAFLQIITRDKANEANALAAELIAQQATADEIEDARYRMEDLIDEGEVVIDDDALASRQENGAPLWVQGWIYVGRPENEEDEEDEEKTEVEG